MLWEFWTTVFCHLRKAVSVYWAQVEMGLLMACWGLPSLNSQIGVVVPLKQERLAGLISTCRPKEQRKLLPPCFEVLVFDLPLVISSCLEGHLCILLLCCTNDMRLFSGVGLGQQFPYHKWIGFPGASGRACCFPASISESLLVQTNCFILWVEWV